MIIIRPIHLLLTTQNSTPWESPTEVVGWGPDLGSRAVVKDKEMAAETQTLNFGPEWLRALSSGGSVASPPPSPALPKYKLADYRYGREEMLALYMKDNKVPEELVDKEFLAILQDEPLLPLALVPLTEEEQRNFSMSVNSSAVMRLMGRGGTAPPAGVVRGRGGARGRGKSLKQFLQTINS